MSNRKVTIATGSLDGFFTRVREHAAALDCGAAIAPSVTITYEDPMELLGILTVERVRLLRCAKSGVRPVMELANALHRDIRAVNRDLRKLEEAGLVRTSLRVNPGHGRSKFVEPVARSYSLNASL